MDARHVSDRKLYAFAHAALDAGAAGVCTLGPRNIKAEMQFESAIVVRHIHGEHLIRKDTHVSTIENDGFAEGLFYFVHCMSPATRYQASCRSWLAVTVGDRNLFRRVRRRLAAYQGQSEHLRSLLRPRRR